MKLTINGSPQTILGVMRKLDICDAKWNVTEGFIVELEDENDQEKIPIQQEPKKTCECAAHAAPKYKTKVCKGCGGKFTPKGGRSAYCDVCSAQPGRRKEKAESQGTSTTQAKSEEQEGDR